MGTNLLAGFLSILWGVQNQGEPQRIKIDHFTSGYVQGIKGEDIHRPIPIADSKKILVAVLDTGLDLEHPAFQGKVSNLGYNFVNNNQLVQDQHGHGTHVSGIIALQSTDQAVILPIKVVQTGPNAPVRPQAVEPGPGTALTENVAKGVVYAVENGAKVINLSLAWPASIRSRKMDEAMAMADQQGVLVIASAANDSTSANLYPCIYSNVICVGAHGPDGAITYFSNHGSMVDILAPGIAIFSTWPMKKPPVTYAGGTGYEFRNGTSMAAPYVAGAAAELLSRGFSPQETRSRLLLGSRKTRTESLYATQLKGDYSADQKSETKFARFGNLDIQNALSINESSLILPEQKSRIEMEWNGTDSFIHASVSWVNRWKKANHIKIKIQDHQFNFDQIEEGSRFFTHLKIQVQPESESLFTLVADVTTEEPNGSMTVRRFPLSFVINRIVSRNSIPLNAERIKFSNIDPLSFPVIRTVIKQDQESGLEYLFIRDQELVLTQNGGILGTTSIDSLKKERLLNFYRIHPSSLAMISIPTVATDQKPVFRIRLFDQNLKITKIFDIDTQKTVLSENLIWRKIRDHNALMWISSGYTPDADRPEYDPWNPNPQDLRLPRIYYAFDSTLHSVTLEKDELPIQLLPNGKILIIRGTDYYSQYYTLEMDQNLHLLRTSVNLNSYRMLIGLNPCLPILDLRTGLMDHVLFQGPSSLGNLRLSSFDPNQSLFFHDLILKRESTLDSLIQVTGAFQENEKFSYFAQTQYDLKYYRSDADGSHSVSLSRYSLIPSMIFNRNFFPLVADTHSGERLPGIYTPASIANADVSEVTFGDPKTGKVTRPALYHIQAKDGCIALGNQIPATRNSPAKLAFICDQQLVLLPIVAPSTW